MKEEKNMDTYYKWEEIEGMNVFLGDLKDQYGRRVLMVVTNGVAVFARCTIEDYRVMKEDFEKMMGDFEFEFAAKLSNGIPYYAKELEESFDMDMLEEITRFLTKSLK